MDSRKVLDQQGCVINLRKEINLIKNHLHMCYLKPENIEIPLECAQEFFAIFLAPEEVAKTLKKNRKDRVNFLDLLEVLEKGFRYIEEYQKPYIRYNSNY
jgi:hypothetical protein